jgi:peptidoglycan hydrolase-like protein with peptidoglycan-binding domain
MPQQNQSDAIRNIQKYLRQLSYHDKAINPVPIDGIWESDTARAVAAFQAKNGLAVTGRVDLQTWEALRLAYEESIAQNSPPISLEIFPREPRDYSLGVGDEGFLVDVVQYILGELESVYYFPDFSISGKYDDATAGAVGDFQKRNRIEPSGRVDRETWDALAVQHNLLVENQ